MLRRLGFSLITIIGYIFISSIVIVLAQGYTVDFESRKFLSTGLFEVNTFPRGATLAVDGVSTTKTTPTTLTHYLPGRYVLDMTFPGYQEISLPIDIESELVTHLDEVSFFPRSDNWRNIVVSTQILNMATFPENSLFLVQTENEIGWWRFQKQRLTKQFAVVSSNAAIYNCLQDGSACLVVDGDQAYLVDIDRRTNRKLKGLPVINNDHSFFKFHDDYVVFAKQGNDLTMQKIYADGSITTQIFVENVDAFVVADQNIWFVKDHAIWSQSLISGLSQKITTVGDGKIKELFVMSDYLLWQKATGETVLFDSSLEAVINTWSSLRIFPNGKDSLAVVQDAKIWLISSERGLLFLGQAASTINNLMPYTKMVWMAQLNNGNSVLVIIDPAKFVDIENHYSDLAILPYEGILARESSTPNTLYYHMFPEQSWLKEIMKN